VVITLDEMGPEAAKSYRGKQVVRAAPAQAEEAAVAPAERAKQALRPFPDRPERGLRPVQGAHALAHFAAAGKPFETNIIII
jgi:hypothetical protein